MKNLSTLQDMRSVRVLSSKQMLHVRGGKDPLPLDLESIEEMTEDDKRRQRPGGGVSTQKDKTD